MARFLLSRLVQFPLILAIIYLTTFTLVWLAPGDPFAMLNERNNPEAAEQLRKQFNADSPWRFLATYPVKLLSGEMGPSFKYQGVQVGDIIRSSLPVSVAIGALAIVIAAGVGIFIGTLDARLIALDARNGAPCASFGNGGSVDLAAGARPTERGQYLVTSPPAVYRDLIITGAAIGDNRGVELERGIVRALSLGRARRPAAPHRSRVEAPRALPSRAVPDDRIPGRRTGQELARHRAR